MYRQTRPHAGPGSISCRSLHTRAERSYNDVINLLNSTQSGFHRVESLRKSGFMRDSSHLAEMRTWLSKLGYAASDLDRLNIIHVAGTKGKGSTSSLASSILDAYRVSRGAPSRVGLYTSPHLTSVRERIRLDEAPIGEEVFARYFSQVWDSFGEPGEERPGYFRLLTLLSFHVFLREGVDAAVYEVGVGGAFDATNVIERPVATGITALGVDHVATLGATLREIAWHKAGIIKRGAPAFTAPQPEEAMRVLEERARESGAELVEVGIHPWLRDVKVRPDEEFQRRNASMAIRLAACALERVGVEVDLEGELPKEVARGIEDVNWRGRCETLVRGRQTWCLDGAHTEESLDIACRWFARVAKESDTPCALIFNQQSDRDAADMLRIVYRNLSRTGTPIKHAVFCTNEPYSGTPTRPDLININVDTDAVSKLSLQNTLAETWRTLDPDTEVAVVASIEDAVRHMSERGELRVFITGSLHLVGGALAVLEGEDSGFKTARA